MESKAEGWVAGLERRGDGSWIFGGLGQARDCLKRVYILRTPLYVHQQTTKRTNRRNEAKIYDTQYHNLNERRNEGTKYDFISEHALCIRVCMAWSGSVRRCTENE